MGGGSRKDHRQILGILGFGRILAHVRSFFFQFGRNCVRLEYYAQQMARFSLVTIYFLLDTGRFLRLRLETGF